MARIRLEEALSLGLIPPDQVAALMERFPAVGRSQVFGSPLFITPSRGAGALQRNLFGFGPYAGLQGLRFGLGPLLQGMGLSPPPSAVTSPGAVPVGMAARRREELTPEQQMLLYAQMERAGALPRSIAPTSPFVPLNPLRMAVSRDIVRQIQEAAGPDGQDVQQALSKARQALGITKDVLDDQSLLRRVVDPILGINPPLGGGRGTPELERAFQAQRAGERNLPLPPLPDVPFASENVARTAGGALPFTETFTDPRFPGLTFPATGPIADIATAPVAGGSFAELPGEVVPPAAAPAAAGAGVAASSAARGIEPGLVGAEEAFQGASTVGTGTAGAAPAFAQSIAPFLKVAGIAGGALGGAQTIYDILRQGEPTPLQALSLVSSGYGVGGPIGAGLGALAIPIMGLAGAFDPKLSHAVREYREFRDTRNILSDAVVTAPDGTEYGHLWTPNDLKSALEGLAYNQARAVFVNLQHPNGQVESLNRLVESGQMDLAGVAAELKAGGRLLPNVQLGVSQDKLNLLNAEVGNALTNKILIVDGAASGTPGAMEALQGRWDQYVQRQQAAHEARLRSEQATAASGAELAPAMSQQYVQSLTPRGASFYDVPSELRGQVAGTEFQEGVFRGQDEFGQPVFSTPAERTVPERQPTLFKPAAFAPPPEPKEFQAFRDLAAQNPPTEPTPTLAPFQAPAVPTPVLPPAPPPPPVPPSPAAPLPAPPAPGEAPPPPSPLVDVGQTGFQHGGIVPRAGTYQLHKGEVVVPAETAKGLPPEHFREMGVEMDRFPSMDQGGSVPRTGMYRMQAGEAVIPAEDLHAYLALGEGGVQWAKKNPDPKKFWRLAFTPQEGRAAFLEGDPAEIPVVVPQAVTRLPGRRMVAAVEAARRAQHQDPVRTLGDFLSPAVSASPPLFDVLQQEPDELRYTDQGRPAPGGIRDTIVPLTPGPFYRGPEAMPQPMTPGRRESVGVGL